MKLNLVLSTVNQVEKSKFSPELLAKDGLLKAELIAKSI